MSSDLNILTYAAAKNYTDRSLNGIGAIAGKPCQIQSIADNADGTHTVTFLWVDNAGANHTSAMTVKDGADGRDGVDAIQIASITATADNKILVTMEDSTEYETAEIPTVKGDDGVSPSAAVERVTNGAKITITDANGTTSATAQDGVSPTATVERNAADDGVVISITDKNGTITQNVYDGSVASTLDYGTSITNRPKVNGVELVGNRTMAELGINMPTKNSQLTNDSGYITADDIPAVDGALSQVSENAVQNKVVTAEIRQTQETVNDLVTEVGNNASAIDILNGSATTDGSVKKQIADAIANIDKLTKKIVENLPSVDDAEENIIYLIENPDGEGYLQYMLVTNDVGAKILASLGGTNIDLTEYYTKTEADTLLAEKQANITGAASTVTTMNVTANRALVSNSNGKIGVSAVKSTELEALSGIEDNIQTQLDGKADSFTADTTPTQNSENPITSGGVYTALQGKQGTLTWDSEPTDASLNPVTSGGIKTALDAKQNTLTFDDRPKQDSANVLSSGVIYDNLASTLQSAKDYTDAAIADFGGFAVVASLDDVTEPNTKTIYLVKKGAAKKDNYEEYIYVVTANVGEWALIGETSLDLSGYVQKTDYASDTTAGLVKVDGSTITADADGTIHSEVSAYDDTEIKGDISAIDDRLSTAESDIDGIEAVIPSGASSSNQLVTADDVIKHQILSFGSTTPSNHYALLYTRTSPHTNFGSPVYLKGFIGSIASTNKVFFDIEVDFRNAPVAPVIKGWCSDYSNEFDIVATYDNANRIAYIYIYVNSSYSYLDVYSENSDLSAATTDTIATPLGEHAVNMMTTDSVIKLDKSLKQSDLTSTVTSGSNSVPTAGAVYNYVPIMTNVNLGSITIAADTTMSVTLSNYGINTHNKPWMAFVWNRSNWKNVVLLGDGNTNLVIHNPTASSVTGNMQIAVLTSPT